MIKNHARDQFNKNFINRFSLLSNKYISNMSNISNIYNLDANLSLAYKKICDRMFSDPKSDNIFSYFWLRTWIIFCLFLYVVISHLLHRWGGVGI